MLHFLTREIFYQKYDIKKRPQRQTAALTTVRARKALAGNIW